MQPSLLVESRLALTLFWYKLHCHSYAYEHNMSKRTAKWLILSAIYFHWFDEIRRE